MTFPEWNKVLETHPDYEFRAYILNGIRNGFRIGFDRSIACHPAATNMKSALENAEVVREYLSKEISLGRIIGPVGQEAIPPGTQVSPFGVIPKSSQPGKWRLIVDLSSPEGASVNVGINQELCSMTYLPAFGRGDGPHCPERQGFASGQARYRECIPHGTHPPRR